MRFEAVSLENFLRERSGCTANQSVLRRHIKRASDLRRTDEYSPRQLRRLTKAEQLLKCRFKFVLVPAHQLHSNGATEALLYFGEVLPLLNYYTATASYNSFLRYFNFLQIIQCDVNAKEKILNNECKKVNEYLSSFCLNTTMNSVVCDY